jgi:hypothetical protein
MLPYVFALRASWIGAVGPSINNARCCKELIVQLRTSACTRRACTPSWLSNQILIMSLISDALRKQSPVLRSIGSLVGGHKQRSSVHHMGEAGICSRGYSRQSSPTIQATYILVSSFIPVNSRTFAGQGAVRLITATRLLVEKSNILSTMLLKFSRPSRLVSTPFLPSFFDLSSACCQNGTPNHTPGSSCDLLPGERAVLDKRKFYMRSSRSAPDCLGV